MTVAAFSAIILNHFRFGFLNKVRILLRLTDDNGVRDQSLLIVTIGIHHTPASYPHPPSSAQTRSVVSFADFVEGESCPVACPQVCFVDLGVSIPFAIKDNFGVKRVGDQPRTDEEGGIITYSDDKLSMQ